MNRVAAFAAAAAGALAVTALVLLAAIPGPVTLTSRRTPAPVAAGPAAVTSPAGVGAALWAPSDRITVTPGHVTDLWVAFYSTGPAETVNLSVHVANLTGSDATFAQAAAAHYIRLPDPDIILPAKPAGPVTLTHVPNGMGGWENITTPYAYQFVKVSVYVCACTRPYTYRTGDAYEAVIGQVQVDQGAGITTSPGAGVALALSVR